jgi:hypothetical protein
MEKHISTPWTKEQVDALNWFQCSGLMHPFTCGFRHELRQTLVATVDGWFCPDDGCDYQQTWAHAFMADRKQVEGMQRSWEFTASGARPDGALQELRKARKQLADAEDELAEMRRLYALECGKTTAMRAELNQLNAVMKVYGRQAAASPGFCDGSWAVLPAEDVDTGGLL